jgi:hypothetical protein
LIDPPRRGGLFGDPNGVSISTAATDILKAMSLTTFKIGKKEFVVLPRRRYDQLTRAEEDQRDAEVARKGREAFLAGKMKTVTLEEARKKWGV